MAQSQNTTTDEQTAAETLDSRDLGTIEYKLKKSLTRRMAAIQEDRALGTESRNVGNAKSYVKEARTLRKILSLKGHQTYKPLSDLGGGHEWLDDRTADAIDATLTTGLTTLCEAMHEVGNPLGPAGTMTEHVTVPGQPSPDREAGRTYDAPDELADRMNYAGEEGQP